MKERDKISKIYKKYLNTNNLTFQKLIKNRKSSLHLFIIRVKSSKRNLINTELRKNNINTNLHYIPIYRHSFYRKYGFKYSDFINAEKYYKEAISLPMYCGLKKNTQMKIIKIINKILA